MNLLTNANKFTEKGTISMVFDYREKVGENDNMLIVDVIDTGIGISAEERDKIFLPFHTTNSQNLNPNGVGLGLSIC